MEELLYKAKEGDKKALEEIAATINKSYNNVRYLKSKTIKKLQKILNNHIYY